MLDYRRFISYLYSYINGEKGVNVGYIRCEQRQGILRFTLNVQDRHGMEEGKYKVYLYKMNEEGVPIGYYLDDLILHRYCGDLRKQTNSQNVWNTGNRIEDFDGIIAIYDAGHMYVSQWSDEMIETYRFITWQDWSKKQRDGAGLNISETKEEASELQAAEYQPKYDINGHRNYDRASEWTCTGSAEARYEAEEKGNCKMMEEEGSWKTEEEKESCKTVEEEDNCKTVGENERCKTVEEKDNCKTVGENDNCRMVEEKDNCKTPEGNGYEEPVKTPAISKLTIRLMENRPKLPDFENHEIYDCVRIEPNDIGLLEMENWRLGVNSFLTHGFYNYKYLMLGKLRFQDGVVKAVLGVPGIYDNKEQYIAKIFGFEVFVPVKHTNTKTGNFGYWIVELT